MTEAIEFDCSDCGIHVYATGIDKVPDPPLCSTCLYIPGWQSDPALNAIFDRDNQLTENPPRRRQMKIIPLQEYHAALQAQNVPKDHEAVICVMCHTPQCIQDFREAGAHDDKIQGQIGFSCVGRHLNSGPATPEGTPQPGKVGCDWSLGGLLHLHELEVSFPDGKVSPAFVPATPEQAKAHYEAWQQRQVKEGTK